MWFDERSGSLMLNSASLSGSMLLLFVVPSGPANDHVWPARHYIESWVLRLSSGCGSEGGHFGACRLGKSKEKTEWNLWVGGQLALIVCVEVSVFAVDGVWCLGVSNEHLKRFCQLESKPGHSQHFPFRGVITCWVPVLAWFSFSLPSSFLTADKLTEPRRPRRQFCIECVSLLLSIALVL